MNASATKNVVRITGPQTQWIGSGKSSPVSYQSPTVRFKPSDSSSRQTSTYNCSASFSTYSHDPIPDKKAKITADNMYESVSPYGNDSE